MQILQRTNSYFASCDLPETYRVLALRGKRRCSRVTELLPLFRHAGNSLCPYPSTERAALPGVEAARLGWLVSPVAGSGVRPTAEDRSQPACA